MPLIKGDHLVIKRDGRILQAHIDEKAVVFEVTDLDVGDRLVMPDGTLCPEGFGHGDGNVWGEDYFYEKLIAVRVVA